MKSTFYFIDKLMILLAAVPPNLATEQDKLDATEIVSQINHIAVTLEALIASHKEEENLTSLRESHIEEVENWANHVEELFRKLHSLLDVVRTDVQILTKIIQDMNAGKDTSQWGSKVRDMALGMVLTGLHDEEEQMARFRKIEVFEVAKLKEIIKKEEHIAELLQ